MSFRKIFPGTSATILNETPWNKNHITEPQALIALLVFAVPHVVEGQEHAALGIPACLGVGFYPLWGVNCGQKFGFIMTLLWHDSFWVKNKIQSEDAALPCTPVMQVLQTLGELGFYPE